jgi:hypothetical protein
MGSELPTTLVWELSKVSSRMSRRRFDHVLTKKALAEICKLKTILQISEFEISETLQSIPQCVVSQFGL